MADKKEKIFVPTYHMGLQEYYFLLRIYMEKTQRRTINGVTKAFFQEETYAKSKKLLKALEKKDIIGRNSEDGIMIRQGMMDIMNDILDSANCMNFQNIQLQKKGQLLSFYYANGRYVGVLQDTKDTMLVASEDVQAVYTAFEKQLEAKVVSPEFKPDAWKLLWEKKDAVSTAAIVEPVRQAMLVISGNRLQREPYNVSLVADRKQIQIISGLKSAKYQEVIRKTAHASDWYGVIVRELERLKEANEGSDGTPKAKEDVKEKSEYQIITETPGFPKNGIGFVFWSLKNIIKGLPGMAMRMIKKKSLALLLYPLWAALLFFYNMYVTCYINDTFMLNRKARWGNLTPYLMAGTIKTPLELKGFQADWGNIENSFLIWPLMMMLTLIGRHLLLQIKAKKIGLFRDIIMIPRAMAECKRDGFGTGKSKWLTYAFAWALGFFIMNPFTFVLIGVYALLVFAQGRDNGMVRFCMLWSCAVGRKKVDAGKKAEPDSRTYRYLVLNIGKGFFLYEIVSILLWFVADYHPWVRLIVSLLMVIYALIQAFCPSLFKDLSKKHGFKAGVLFSLLLLVVIGVFLETGGIVWADDGGWTESGGYLQGLIQNAGFSIILGISLATIGLAIGGPIGAGIVITGILGGVGTFAVGYTDTKAGEYVRKSARQYFFGPEDDEEKTLFCGATEVLSFVSGFLNPAAGAGKAATNMFYLGKITTDVVSTAGDLAAFTVTCKEFEQGEASWDEVAWGAAGLFLDGYGMSSDVFEYSDEIKKMKDLGMDYKFDNDSYFWQKKELESQKNAEIADAKQNSLNAEKVRYENEIQRVNNEIDRVMKGDVDADELPEAWKAVGKEPYKKYLEVQLKAELDEIHLDNVETIKNGQTPELSEKISDIEKKYDLAQKDLAKKEIRLEHVKKSEEINNRVQSEITDVKNTVNTQYQFEMDQEIIRHEAKVADIEDDIRRLDNGEIDKIPGGMDAAGYRKELQKTLNNEYAAHGDKSVDIWWKAYKQESNAIANINKRADAEKLDMWIKEADKFNKNKGMVEEKIQDYFKEPEEPAVEVEERYVKVAEASDGESGFLNERKHIEARKQNDISDLQSDIRADMQEELKEERDRYEERAAEINKMLHELPNGADGDSYRKELQMELRKEQAAYRTQAFEIRAKYREELLKQTTDIAERAENEMVELVIQELSELLDEDNMLDKSELFDGLRKIFGITVD